MNVRDVFVLKRVGERRIRVQFAGQKHCGVAVTHEEFWQSYLGSLAADEPRPESYHAWSFGDTPDTADELGALAARGVKTGTASLAWEYAQDTEPFPRVGELSIVLDGAGEPLCVIETTRVYTAPFDQVDAEHAYAEGEGDRSLAYWRDVHWRIFSRWCAEIGREPSESMPVVCERFRVVWKERHSVISDRL